MSPLLCPALVKSHFLFITYPFERQRGIFLLIAWVEVEGRSWEFNPGLPCGTHFLGLSPAQPA